MIFLCFLRFARLSLGYPSLLCLSSVCNSCTFCRLSRHNLSAQPRKPISAGVGSRRRTGNRNCHSSQYVAPLSKREIILIIVVLPALVELTPLSRLLTHFAFPRSAAPAPTTNHGFPYSAFDAKPVGTKHHERLDHASRGRRPCRILCNASRPPRWAPPKRYPPYPDIISP